MIAGGAVVLRVKDPESAARFYIETLGMKLVAEDADSVVIDAGEGFRLLLAAGDTPASRPVVHLYAKVPLDEAIAIYDNRGVAMSVERAGSSARSARFEDPDGNAFVLLPAPPSDHSAP